MNKELNKTIDFYRFLATVVMEKKEKRMENKKYMFVPITFEEACDELKAGRHRAVYIENEHEDRLESMSKWGSRILGDWMFETTYYKKVEVTKEYIYIHLDDLEKCSVLPEELSRFCKEGGCCKC